MESSCVCCGVATFFSCDECEDAGCAECFEYRRCTEFDKAVCCRCAAWFYRNPVELVCGECGGERFEEG